MQAGALRLPSMLMISNLLRFHLQRKSRYPSTRILLDGLSIEGCSASLAPFGIRNSIPVRPFLCSLQTELESLVSPEDRSPMSIIGAQTPLGTTPGSGLPASMHLQT